MTMPFNPFAGFLEDKPEAAYFSYGDRFSGPGRSQRQANFFTNRFSDIYNQYLGSLGKQVQAGLMPSGSFNDYLGGFDFEKWYRQQVPYGQRSEGFNNFVPSLRWRMPGING